MDEIWERLGELVVDLEMDLEGMEKGPIELQFEDHQDMQRGRVVPKPTLGVVVPGWQS